MRVRESTHGQFRKHEPIVQEHFKGARGRDLTLQKIQQKVPSDQEHHFLLLEHLVVRMGSNYFDSARNEG